jgi:uncharacterized protein YndB with AHSA1/START domain
MDELGQIRGTGDTRTLRFSRRLEAQPARVWEALTDHERLADWLTEATFEGRAGGQVAFDFGEGGVIRGTVAAWAPPRLLEYGWTFPDGQATQVRWTLEADGAGTLLTLVHEGLLPAQAAGYGAGWHAFLDRLAGRLAGTPPAWDDRFAELQPRYAKLAQQTSSL